MPIETVIPTSLDELHYEVRQLPQRQNNTPAQTHFPVYRGCANSEWDLQSSLMRLGGDLLTKERLILEEFGRSGRSDLVNMGFDAASELTITTVAQHYGAPTRLLDWSKRYDVAEHFATCNLGFAETEGAIWVVNPHLVHEMLPPSIRAELSPERPEDPAVLRQNRFASAYPELSDFDRQFNPPYSMPTVFFEGTLSFPRITNQAGLFSVVANAGVSIRDVLDKIDGSCRKILLSPDIKALLRAELDAQDTDERRLFPGLDGVGSYLRRLHLGAAS